MSHKRLRTTQLSTTPTLEGKDAERLIESLKHKPTEKSKENAEKLSKYFNSFEKGK